MRMLTGKRALSILLITILLFTLLPLYPYAAENVAKDHAALNRSETSEGFQSAKSPEQPTEDFTRWDIYEIIFGTLLLLVGFSPIVLAVLRWQSNDFSLISFGNCLTGRASVQKKRWMMI